MTVLYRLASAGLFAAAFVSAPAGAAMTSISQTLVIDHALVLQTMPGAPQTIGTFDFGAAAASLSDITGISITLALEDGDSAVGNFDWNHLSLGLDGVQTGLLLNGYPDNELSLPLPQSLFGSLPSSIYNNLELDHALIVDILDLDSDTTKNQRDNANGFNRIKLPKDSSVTLTLFGTAVAPKADPVASPTVPEPATLALAGLGLAGMTLSRRRRTA